MHRNLDLLLFHACIVTPTVAGQAGLTVWQDGAIAVADGRIVAIGPTEQVLLEETVAPRTELVHGAGRVCLPSPIRTIVFPSGEPSDPDVSLVWNEAIDEWVAEGVTVAALLLDRTWMTVDRRRRLAELVRHAQRQGLSCLLGGEIGALSAAAGDAHGAGAASVADELEQLGFTFCWRRPEDHEAGNPREAERLARPALPLLDVRTALPAAPGRELAFLVREGQHRARTLVCWDPPGRTFGELWQRAISLGAQPEAVLSWLTIEAAAVLGVADQVGSLHVGKEASFLLLDGVDWRTPLRPTVALSVRRGRLTRRARPKGLPAEDGEPAS